MSTVSMVGRAEESTGTRFTREVCAEKVLREENSSCSVVLVMNLSRVSELTVLANIESKVDSVFRVLSPAITISSALSQSDFFTYLVGSTLLRRLVTARLLTVMPLAKETLVVK